jgi:salicylate hydroxylase
MDSANTIAIIGAGIGGLAAALALLRQGLDVDVYEQSPELGEIGAGIQISANGTRVLYALGLETALHGIEVLPSRRQIRHWSTGETWDWFELGAVTRERLRHAPRDAAPRRPAPDACGRGPPTEAGRHPSG